MKPQSLLIIGLLIGVAAGLLYTWVLSPVAYYDTYPPMLYEAYRADWIRMTAFAYGLEGNLRYAELRLQDLPSEEIRRSISEALDDAVATGRPLPVLKRMAELAERYGVKSPAVRIYAAPGEAVALATLTLQPPLNTSSPILEPSDVPVTATPTPVTGSIFLPVPLSPTPTPVVSPYSIIEREESCLPAPRIAVSLTQAITVTIRGRDQLEMVGLPGVEVWLLWDGGADRAVTGLRPEQGLGYADFDVQPGEIYNLYLGAPSGAPLTSIRIEPCTSSDADVSEEAEGAFWTSWLIQVQLVD